MKSEPDSMDPSVELLQGLVDNGVCTPKQMALWAGRESKTAYKYLDGTLTPPPFLFRRIYEETGDLRVVLFFVGSRPICVHQAQPVRLGDPKDLVPQLIDGVKEAASSLDYVNRIVQDGRVDASDDQAIAQFESHAARLMQLVPAAVASLKALRQKGGVA